MTRGSLTQSRSRGVKYADPLHAGRHPFQTYLLTLAVVSAIPIMVGHAPPASIEQTMPHWLATTWGIMLFGGSLLALVGSYWLGNYPNALTIERVGLLIVGAAALLYGMAIYAVNGPTGFVAAGITVGFGAACLKRSRDIGKVFNLALKAPGLDI
jgi:hypothetical protein